MLTRLILNRLRSRTRREGTAAIEFAIVAIPFFFALFMVMELGIIFLIDAMMESSIQRASRLVRTGQAQDSAITKAQFKTAFCEGMSVFEGECRSKAVVDVREIPQFRNPNPPNPIVDGVMQEDQTEFDPANAGSLVLVRVWYSYPLATPMLSQAMTRMKSGEALISVTTAFRNEPF